MSGNTSPTDGHWQVTLDDRALLLPSSPSASSSSSVAAVAGGGGGGGGDGCAGGGGTTTAVAAERDTRAKPSSLKVKPSSMVGGGRAEAEAEAADIITAAGSSCGLDVYTITADNSLPSHMRSLLPGHDKHVHDLLTWERTRQRLRYVILGLTLMLALTVLVAVALVLSLKVTPPHSVSSGFVMDGGHFRAPSFPAAPDAQDTELTTEVKVSLLDDSSSRHHPDTRTRYRHVGPKERRTPCVTECWSYAAFRFRSDCQQGFCRCHGDNYDTYSCLPQYHDCNIEKEFPSHSSTKLLGRNQTTYVCHVPSSREVVGSSSGGSSSGSDIHVVSIFGNHRAPTTHVTVLNQPPSSSSSPSSSPSSSSSSSPSSRTLVLVNYHFVEWTVHLPENSGITKVIIVSMKRSNQADGVHFTGPAKNPDVEVTYKLSLTGYGDDKNGGHTPKLLRFIEEKIGPVTSFLGASHADEIFVDLSKSRR